MHQTSGPVAGGDFDRFGFTTYLVRSKVMKLFGGAFYIYGPDGQLALYSKQKAFKLKEDIRLYTGEDMRQEVLTIQARQIVDWSAAYDVVDPSAGKVGALKRKGWKSMLKDEWILMDGHDREIGLIKEDSALMAMVRRFLTNLIPQAYHADIGGMPVCTFKQKFNPFIPKMVVDFSADPQEQYLDRRLGLAAAVLLMAIEGRQQ